MNINWWYVGGGVGAVIILFLIEETREMIFDSFVYFISFQWLPDLWENFVGLFENLGEFSAGGLVFGLLSGGVVFLSRNYMLAPFLQYMSPVSKIFWTVATYASCLIVGYLVGKRLFEDS